MAEKKQVEYFGVKFTSDYSVKDALKNHLLYDLTPILEETTGRKSPIKIRATVGVRNAINTPLDTGLDIVEIDDDKIGVRLGDALEMFKRFEDNVKRTEIMIAVFAVEILKTRQR